MKKIKPFTKQQLLKEIEKHNLVIPVEELIAMGEKRQWKTKKGNKFKTCEIFAACMNGVYLQRLRKDGGMRNINKYDLFSDDIVSYINSK